MSVTSLLPIRLDLLLVRKTDNLLEVVLSNPVTGVAYDITLDSVKMTVRDGYTGTDLLTVTNAPGGHYSPTAGTTRLDLTKVLLEDAAHAGIRYDFEYEIRRILPDADEVVFFAGKFSLLPTPAPV